jgi:hypothetical protein
MAPGCFGPLVIWSADICSSINFRPGHSDGEQDQYDELEEFGGDLRVSNVRVLNIRPESIYTTFSEASNQ